MAATWNSLPFLPRLLPPPPSHSSSPSLPFPPSRRRRRSSAVSLGQESSASIREVADHPGTPPAGSTKGSSPPIYGDDEGGRSGLEEFFAMAAELVAEGKGSPRWFSPWEGEAAARPEEASPVLLYLPGVDGTGAGLASQQGRLSKLFEIWCLHIPPLDRTPFPELVKLVEQRVRSHAYDSPGRPVYLVGESVGACLALSVAARNPDVDLVLILANPATSFDDSPIRPLVPLLDLIPGQLPLSQPFLLSLLTGDPLRKLRTGSEKGLPPGQTVGELSKDLSSMPSRLSVLGKILSQETLVWKIRMLKSSSAFTNSRIHAVKAQTLILASGKDQLLPSAAEGERLYNTIPNSDLRRFPESGHYLFLEDGFNLLTTIKAIRYYRRGRTLDYVLDYLLPTHAEFKQVYDSNRLIDELTAPVILSTMEDGKIVRGFDGIPAEGPVLLVGYHMLLGLELVPLVARLFDQRNILARGIAHPMLFLRKKEGGSLDESTYDTFKIMGAVPVSGINLYKLFATKSHILLYPGGMREALHRKGEEYKLFWPEQSEFVRMAARFGAKIVPFGTVGEDDIGEIVLDYDDLIRIPFMSDSINEMRESMERANVRLRTDAEGEVANQDAHFPGILPKVPGRFYYYFGKPIETAGRKQELRDREKANELYLEVKAEVEKCIAYLREKRESDPYRNIVPRLIYQATNGHTAEIPTFDI
ncbi:hypothetical protein MLD38_000285 [Melastoma candidum]|uniref:Uncharacterized protein n=1 Tax=Melastoma candidum TaxID=119954 RepID=A0ACB9SBI8_9MYRT|nr:hypothetical protein MLD38_000285 [Melastoma candidum]